MSIKPRTINNIGIDASTRYAKDQAQLDTKLIEESRFIGPKAQVSALKPYITTDFDLYLQPNKPILWATFAPPPNYMAYDKPLFTYQLIPSLGGWEKQEADAEKLAALEDSINKKKKKKKQSPAQEEEINEEESELKIVLHLLKTISQLDRTLSLINSRRNQYQRG